MTHRHSRFLVTVVVALLAMTLGRAQQSTKSLEAKLGEALHVEEIEGNTERAISMYASIANNPSAKPPVAARALLQMAGCYEKLGRPEATPTYQQVVDRYARYEEAATIVRRARTKLAAIQTSLGQPVSVAQPRCVLCGCIRGR